MEAIVFGTQGVCLWSRVRCGMALTVVACSVLCLGCNRGPARYPASGQVVFADGTPLRGGNVEFHGEQIDNPWIASGTIGEDGKFELTTRELGRGAVPGDYVGVIAPATPDDLAEVPKAQRFAAMHPIDDKYRDYETSPIRIRVSQDSSQNNFRIEVQAPKRNARK